jgi:hypothetical protein
LIPLYEVNLRHPTYLFNDALGELSGVTFEVSVIDVADALREPITKE